MMERVSNQTIFPSNKIIFRKHSGSLDDSYRVSIVWRSLPTLRFCDKRREGQPPMIEGRENFEERAMF